MAVTTVIQEKLEMLGTRKYFTPASAPGRVTEYTAMTTDSTTRMGIITLETRSTPLRTPAKMMASVAPVKMTKHTSADRPLAMKLEK